MAGATTWQAGGSRPGACRPTHRVPVRRQLHRRIHHQPLGTCMHVPRVSGRQGGGAPERWSAPVIKRPTAEAEVWVEKRYPQLILHHYMITDGGKELCLLLLMVSAP